MNAEHMTPRTYQTKVLVLSAAGTLFAGYLSAIKLFTGACAFNEPCPYFIGYPACWYGFGMFLSLFLVSLAAISGKMRDGTAVRALAAVSGLGILFAGNFVVREIAGWIAIGRFSGYGLVLPTCVYGLIFYLLVLGLSVHRLRTMTPAK